jgi:hypothetical protein
VDSDLAGVRDKAALTRLPATERDGWHKLWAEVTNTLARARRPAAADKKSAPK